MRLVRGVVRWSLRHGGLRTGRPALQTSTQGPDAGFEQSHGASQSEPEKPGQLNTSRQTISQDSRNPQSPPFGSALLVGGQVEIPRQGCWTQGGWGVLGTWAGCSGPPSRSLSMYPLPASCFCFGATGTSSSHHSSKWLAGLSRGLVRGWSSQPKAIHRCAPRGWQGPLKCELWPFPSIPPGALDEASSAPWMEPLG